MSERKIGLCFLCHEDKELRNSHIIPKFMTKKIREAPSRVYIIDKDVSIKQDTIKYHMLCAKCEGKFNKLETNFSKDIVKNYKNGKIVYTSILYDFALSLFWRIMEYRVETIEQSEKSRYKAAFSVKEYMREFLHSGKPFEEQEIYMFVLDGSKCFNFSMLASRKKVGGITYSIYGKFATDGKSAVLDCQKDSATNYSLTKKMPFQIEEFPFSYFNVFQDDDSKILFVIAEQFIFCLNMLNEPLDFPEQSKVRSAGGIWENIQFPAKINKYLAKYGEEVNLDVECSDKDIENIKVCLKSKGIAH